MSIIELFMWPISVAILILLVPFEIENPQGFAASWGIENGWISKSFIEKFSLFTKYFLSIIEVSIPKLLKVSSLI